MKDNQQSKRPAVSCMQDVAFIPLERDQREERDGLLPSTRVDRPAPKPMPRPYQNED